MEPDLISVCPNDQTKKRGQIRHSASSPWSELPRAVKYMMANSKFSCVLWSQSRCCSACVIHATPWSSSGCGKLSKRTACAWVPRGWTMHQQVTASQKPEINILMAHILSVITDRGLVERCLTCSDKWTRALKPTVSLELLSLFHTLDCQHCMYIFFWAKTYQKAWILRYITKWQDEIMIHVPSTCHFPQGLEGIIILYFTINGSFIYICFEATIDFLPITNRN